MVPETNNIPEIVDLSSTDTSNNKAVGNQDRLLTATHNNKARRQETARGQRVHLADQGVQTVTNLTDKKNKIPTSMTISMTLAR